jgi:hypothetical protein
MANANVLVPGTAGITFIDNSGADVGYPVKMRLGTATGGLLGKSTEELEELLSMSHQPGQIEPHRTSLKPGTSLRPGHALAVAYNQIPGSFNHFLYDWRADMRHSARQLLDFLRQRKPASGRWNVVGHSQGALLVVLASRMAAEGLDPLDPASREAFAAIATSVTMVGAPLAGTVNAARAIVVGDGAGEAAAPVFKRILRTWPALFQMTPAWPAVVDEEGDEAPPEHQLSAAGGWPHLEVPDDMIERARAARILLRDPLSHLRGDVQVAVLCARNRNTGLLLERRAGWLDGEPVVRQKGDSLVPFEQTLAWVGDHLRPYLTVFDPPVNEHAFLLDDPAILRRVRQLLR